METLMAAWYVVRLSKPSAPGPGCGPTPVSIAFASGMDATAFALFMEFCSKHGLSSPYDTYFGSGLEVGAYERLPADCEKSLDLRILARMLEKLTEKFPGVSYKLGYSGGRQTFSFSPNDG